MVDRISDLGLQQTLLSGFQQAQQGSADRQIQLSTGKVSNRYSGVTPEVSQLLSAEGVIESARAFQGAAEIAGSRLQLQEGSITTIADSVSSLRERIVTTLASGSAELLIPSVENLANQALTALNAQFGGVFVFGGTDGLTAASSAQDFDDLLAAADVSSLLAAGSRLRLPVDDGVFVDGGATALELAEDFLTEFKAIGEASATLGAFDGNLTTAQQNFLVDRLTALDRISANLNRELGLNGIAQSQANDAIQRATIQSDLAELIVSDIEDVDIAEVISQLSQDQVAIEAAGRALSQATQLSLLNFI